MKEDPFPLQTLIAGIDWSKIDSVFSAETDSLAQIAAAGHLDPKSAFRGARMVNVSLSGIDIRGIDFSFADLRGTRLREARLDSTTIIDGAIIDAEDRAALGRQGLKKSLSVILCSPRGFCAGEVRAIDTVERALELYGPPVYVPGPIVHGQYVLSSFSQKGAIFVEGIDEIPETDAPVIFPVHGVPSAAVAEAKRRNLFVLDATCPLIIKIHREVRIHFKRGRDEILVVGRATHAQARGIVGQLPLGTMTVIETLEQANTYIARNPDKLAYVTQSNLSVHGTKTIIEALTRRFPNIRGPYKTDICYATSNRQAAVAAVAPKVEAMVILGARNSLNAVSLRDTALLHGCQKTVLVERAGEIEWPKLGAISSLGISCAVSVPEVIVEELLGILDDHYEVNVESHIAAEENEFFPVPRPLRKVDPTGQVY